MFVLRRLRGKDMDETNETNDEIINEKKIRNTAIFIIWLYIFSVTLHPNNFLKDLFPKLDIRNYTR